MSSQDGAPPPVQMPAGLNDAFVLIYKIIAILIALTLGVMFLTTAMDIFLFQRGELQQTVKLVLNKNLFNKDTTDTAAMDYLKNNPDDEPYNIFLEQKMIGSMFTLTGVGLTVLGLQVGTFFSLKMWSVVKRAEFTERIDLPLKLILVLVIGFGAATFFNSNYNQIFVKKTQPNMKSIRTQMVRLNTLIYTSLTNDVRNRFLPALLSDDLDTCVKVLREYLKRGNPNDTELTAEDYTALKMLFTINIYGFYRYMIPEGDPVFDELRGLFTTQGIRKREIEPTAYMYYKQAAFVPNAYPTVRDRLQPLLGMRERMFVVELGKMMRELNRQMVYLQDISGGKKALFSYLLATFAVALLWIILVIGVFYQELSPFLGVAAQAAAVFWEKGKFLIRRILFMGA